MVMGNPEAPIKLEEFGAFTCGHCAQFTKDSHEELKRDFIDTGRVSYKLTPFMLHPVDAIAGAIVKCTGPDRFFPLAEATFIEHEAFIAGASKPQPGTEEAMKLPPAQRSEEHTSELQSLMRISYAVFCLKKHNKKVTKQQTNNN